MTIFNFVGGVFMKTLEIAKSAALSKILFATDFSPYSEAALPYALRLANQYGAQLYATHVLSPEAYLFATPESWPALIEGQEQRQQLDIARLEEHLRSVPHQVLSAVGDTSDVLIRLIQDNQIDLLVLGTHGRSGLPKLLMGSVAEKIFRQSPIPVLTVGPHAPRERSTKKFSRIVFATDLSDESLAALPHAMALVQDHNAHLTVLHVLDGTTKGIVDFEAGAKFALRQMQELAPIDPELGIYPDYAVEFGPVADQILRFCEERDADVVVLGVRALRGRLGTATHLARTTAQHIVGHATCPVLTVRG
jgi:nucleotide-binding universal stress UspA family protein